MTPRALPEGFRKAGIRQRREYQAPPKCTWGANSRLRDRIFLGRHCSALRGRTIRVVAFRASHPVKPPSRQQRFVQRFREHPRLSLRISLFYPLYAPTPSMV